MTIPKQYSPPIDEIIYDARCQEFKSQDFLKLAIAALDQWDSGSEEALELIVALEAFVEPCTTCDGTGRITLSDKQTIDGGSKWQRTDIIEVEDDCPACNGGIW